MSRYMTPEEIRAEQKLIKQQATQFVFNVKPDEEYGPDVDEVEVDHHDVSPIDLLNGENYTDKATRDARYDVCKGCDRLFKLTRTCKECGCFMAAKTWISAASCPLGRW